MSSIPLARVKNGETRPCGLDLVRFLLVIDVGLHSACPSARNLTEIRHEGECNDALVC